ncbi:MAG TPA: DUF72 domain-containing protein [Candidatus Limnocylindria bacterium]|jgi:uncharacterized protein YecE (DUF72 family)|nr:DUF72 domain-containing protein [Candidatus Limnocylindria bacterium]
METEFAGLLPTEDDPRQPLRQRLAALAQDGIYLGTSSWKYPGWLGNVYTDQRYEFRGKFSEARFNQHCLAEYAETFKAVGVDATYYHFPSEKSLGELAAPVPADFRFSFKVTDEITAKRFPLLPRHAERGGLPNPNFLNADLCAREFLRPLETIRERVGLVMFEFSRFHAPDFARGRDFVAVLDRFLGELPTGWRYGVEVRNRNLLHPEFFGMLAARGVAFLFNLWSDGPSLDLQLMQPGGWTTGFAGARLLTRPGTVYEEREAQLLPFDQLREPFPEARNAAVRMIREARRRGVPLFLHFGNKFEGSAPLSLAAVVAELDATAT